MMELRLWNGLLLLLLLVGVSATNSTLEVEEVEEGETFQDVEKKLRDAVGSAIKKLLPYLMRGSSQADISQPCSSSIIRIIGGVRNLREWAVRFIDATGKIPPGILEGTSLSIGDYDECLDIEVGKRDDPPRTPKEVVFRGQYCLLEAHRPEGINKAIKEFQEGNKDSPIAKTKTFLNMFVRHKHLTNSTFKLGVCVPSKCSQEDISKVLSSESLQLAGKITVSYCKQKDEEERSLEQICLVCLIGFILGFVILSTAADAVLRLRSDVENPKKDSPYKSYVRQIVKNTSLYSNALEVLNTSKCQEPIRCLCGIRPITVILIIFSHTYGHLHVLHFQKFSKAANFIKFFDSFTFSGIANGSVVVDTIAFIAGLTITYNRWRFKSEKGTINLNICKLLLQRYFRLSLAQLLVIFLFMMAPLFGSGPFWSAYMDPVLNNCRNKWYLNILYVNNFFPSINTCLYHTWILALVMQLTLLSVIILWILKKSMRFGIFLMIGIILAGIIGVGVMTVIHNLPGSMAFFMLDHRTGPITWRDMYILPYDHMGPFCIGLLAGFILAKKKDLLEIGRTTNAVLWCSAIACNCAVLFGLYSYRHGEPMDLPLSTFYAVMHRNMWAVGIGWLVVACATQNGGPVTRVLHSRLFLPLDRLWFMAFMMHIPIMFFHSGVMRERWFMGHFELLFLAIGYIAMSFVCSFFLNIIFVHPYYALERFVCSYFGCKEKISLETKTNLKTSTGPNGSINASEGHFKNNECVNLAYSKTLDGL